MNITIHHNPFLQLNVLATKIPVANESVYSLGSLVVTRVDCILTGVSTSNIQVIEFWISYWNNNHGIFFGKPWVFVVLVKLWKSEEFCTSTFPTKGFQGFPSLNKFHTPGVDEPVSWLINSKTPRFVFRKRLDPGRLYELIVQVGRFFGNGEDSEGFLAELKKMGTHNRWIDTILIWYIKLIIT